MEPPPLPSESAPPQPVPPWARVLVFLALAAFFLVVVPWLAFMVGAIPFAGGARLGARPLYELGALDLDYEKALSKGVALAVVFFALGLGWRGVRWAATKFFDAPAYRPKYLITGPTETFLAGMAFHFLVLVPIDRLGLKDIDDSQLGAAVVAVVVFTSLSLGWLAVRGVWALLALLWRATRIRAVLAGLVIASASGLSGLVGLGGAAAWLFAEAQSHGQPVLAASDPIEESRQLLVEFAMASGPRAPVSSMASLGSGWSARGSGKGGGSDLLEACVRTLQSTPPSPSEIERARRKYEDTLVWEAVGDVCLRYARGGISGRLQPYFQKSLQYAKCRQYRSPWSRCETVPWEECTLYSEDDPTARTQQRMALKKLCQLSALDEQVLRLAYVEELTGPEIAARLGITPAAARQRKKAATDRLLARFPELSR